MVDSELADTVVVDDDSAAHIEGEVRFDIYTQPYTEEVNSLFYLGDEISKHPWQSNDDINHFFVANPSLNYPIDVRQLVTLAKTATPDVNYNLITGLSGKTTRTLSILPIYFRSGKFVEKRSKYP